MHPLLSFYVHLKTLLARRSDEDGVTAVEYGMIAAGIAVVIIAIVFALGGHLNTVFSKVDTSIQG